MCVRHIIEYNTKLTKFSIIFLWSYYAVKTFCGKRIHKNWLRIKTGAVIRFLTRDKSRLKFWLILTNFSWNFSHNCSKLNLDSNFRYSKTQKKYQETIYKFFQKHFCLPAYSNWKGISYYREMWCKSKRNIKLARGINFCK